MRRLPLLLAAGLVVVSTAHADRSAIRLVEFDTTVNPITAMRIVKAIDEAETEEDDLVLIVLDTPGGLVVSMQKIVQKMLNAEVPVAVWVGPAGADAGSAGFFILMAADVAAMAPGTRAGAASVVYGGGQQSQDGDVLLKKANEDLAALVRSICERRGRDKQVCEEAVFSAKSYEESVALESGLVDFVAATEEELLEQLDGREVVRFDGTTVTLNTAEPRFVRTEFDWTHAFREFLAHPTVAYALLMLGILGIWVEMTHPGLIFPGVVGAMSILLFAVASTSLPVTAIGVLLIALAIVMFVLEIKVTSYGMLTLGGTIALLLGSILLIDGPIPELRVPPSTVVPISLTVAICCAYILRLALRAQRSRVTTGVEGLTGAIGKVDAVLDPEGKVFVQGEIWNARTTDGPVEPGTRVRVLGVDGLTVEVEPYEPDEGDKP